MSRLFIGVFFTMVTASSIFAQSAVRYKDPLFTDVQIRKGISYRGADAGKRGLLDVYLPEGDSLQHRPVMIWMHGGGFKFGKKTARGIPLWCRQFAKKGYVCVAINYRLSKEKTLSDPGAFKHGCQEAVTDLYAAVDFLRSNQTAYGIDCNQLILAGNSAGATIALQAAYGIPNGFGTTAQTAELLPVKAVINYWGALFDTTWMANSSIPIFTALGEHDRVVPPRTREGFMFGGILIHEAANRYNIPNELIVYPHMGHELQRHFIPFIAGFAVHKRWKKAGEQAAAFLYQELFSN